MSTVEMSLAPKSVQMPVADARPKPIQVLDKMIKGSMKTLQSVAAKNIDHEKCARMLMMAVQQNPKLMECTPESLVGCLINSSAIGLEVGSSFGYAHLVPYKTKDLMTCQLQIGYSGYIKLAFESGKVKSLQAEVVYEGDEFAFELGSSQKIIHRPALKDRGEPVAYYAMVSYSNGGEYFRVMSVEDMEIHAKTYSVAYAKGWSTPWSTNFNAMAKKTMIRLIKAYLPMSPEIKKALDADYSTPTDKVDSGTGLCVPANVDMETGEVIDA
jgi:recombination protein RecT